MKRIIVLLSLLFCNTIYADTINLYWLNEDGSTYQNSTCEINSDLIIPSTPPTKYGYTFTGWKLASYTPIEYLQSTGAQSIDTLWKPTTENVEIVFKLIYNAQNASYFGRGNSGTEFGQTTLYSNKLYIARTSQISSSFSTSSTPTVLKIKILNGNLYTYQNDVLKTQTSYSGTITENNTNLRIFSSYYVGKIMQPSSYKLYYFKIYENGVLVRDFIPVLDVKNTPCLLDMVEKKYYYNQGTGQFTAGPVLQQ